MPSAPGNFVRSALIVILVGVGTVSISTSRGDTGLASLVTSLVDECLRRAFRCTGRSEMVAFERVEGRF